ncbi:MAG: saccharopine dehydrogenase NADP-binding domain-containing protein, partial [Planctomycetales bacterium]|nr:saccharopine dehydrogenase NADP-binding domain-containing protein [Planctomycetales bacterium]
MARVLLLGGGKIGRMIAKFLTATGDYRLTVGDVERSSLERMQSKVPVDVRVVDAADGASLRSAMADHDLVISALSYRFNPAVAQAAADCGLS